MTHPTLTDLALALDDARKALARAQKVADEAQRDFDAAVEDERRRRELEADGKESGGRRPRGSANKN